MYFFSLALVSFSCVSEFRFSDSFCIGCFLFVCLFCSPISCAHCSSSSSFVAASARSDSVPLIPNHVLEAHYLSIWQESSCQNFGISGMLQTQSLKQWSALFSPQLLCLWPSTSAGPQLSEYTALYPQGQRWYQFGLQPLISGWDYRFGRDELYQSVILIRNRLIVL